MFASIRRLFHGAAAVVPVPLTAEAREGKAWAALSTVMDPELGIDLVSMGLIREVIVQGAYVDVRMTLSTPRCPVGPAIVGSVERALRGVGLDPEVKLEFEPKWTPDEMSPTARLAYQRRRG